MNCTDVHTILDEHRDARLTAAERGAVDAHLIGCADCTAAWHAHGELLALAVPAMAPAFPDSVLSAIDSRSRPTRHVRRGMIVATALFAGAALAAIGVMQSRTLRRHDSAPAVAATRAQTNSPSGPATVWDRAPKSAPAANSLPVDTTAIDLFVAPIVRTPPDYPAAAIERGLEGSVTLQFDVTAQGTVENVSVVDSTEPVFEKAAADALAQWKYLPRIAGGKRVAAPAERTAIRFQLDRRPAPAAPLAEPSPPFDFAGFDAALRVAWQRVASDDLRGAELQLDEARARFKLNGYQEGGIWDFYAYLYTVEGNYDRAIDAYETGIVAYGSGGWRSQGAWVALANLYLARHQYDFALQTMLRYKEAIRGTPGERGGTSVADDFIARLAALGVTQATLPPRR